MAALVTAPGWDAETRQAKVAAVIDAKQFEAAGGADGALIYDTTLQPVVRAVFDAALRELEGGQQHGAPAVVNQLGRPPVDPTPVTPAALLKVPPGGITREGVEFNVAIGVRFVEAWLRGVRKECGRGGGDIRMILTLTGRVWT